MQQSPTRINIETTVKAPVEMVWKTWITVEDIIKWNSASPDWHTPMANQDLKQGGKFLFRMEAKDGSFGFDFVGVYDRVIPKQLIAYTLGDGRRVQTTFVPKGKLTKVEVTFEAESINSINQQEKGWQAILENFKKYTESKS
ncbi:MAG: SRPBCC family protein [Flavisolibacter sp.]